MFLVKIILYIPTQTLQSVIFIEIVSTGISKQYLHLSLNIIKLKILNTDLIIKTKYAMKFIKKLTCIPKYWSIFNFQYFIHRMNKLFKVTLYPKKSTINCPTGH